MENRIDDSKMKELAAIVENHNREIREQEIKGLREQLENKKWILGMKVKTLKVREASHKILIIKHNQVERQCKSQVAAVNNQLNKLKSIREDSDKKTQTIKMHFREAKERWKEKEEKFDKEIENLNVYIHNLHLTLERNGIPNDQLIEESDECESDETYEVDWSEYLNRPDEYDSDTQFEDEDDEDCDDDFDMPRPPTRRSDSSEMLRPLTRRPDSSFRHQNMQQERSLPLSEDYDYDHEEVHLEQMQCSEPRDLDSFDLIEEDGKCFESSQDVDQTPSSEDDVPQEPNSCDKTLSEDSGFEQSQLTEFVHNDLSSSEIICNNEDEQSQQVTSNSNAVVQEIGSKKPVEALPFNMDPFVHGYIEESFREKPKSKPKKPLQKKSKSKPKFSSLVSFGGY